MKEKCFGSSYLPREFSGLSVVFLQLAFITPLEILLLWEKICPVIKLNH